MQFLKIVVAWINLSSNNLRTNNNYNNGMCNILLLWMRKENINSFWSGKVSFFFFSFFNEDKKLFFSYYDRNHYSVYCFMDSWHDW